ncbi:MAG: CopG family transcriptional regulator [Gammaproteobacteria bacterium]|nr:CopG family transcriptional regulator [Gammaproteobacteria bacterium]
MKNVTVTLDDETALWVRVAAARRNTSVSKLLGEILAEQMHIDQGYEAAKQRFLSKEPEPLRSEPHPYPDRDTLYER